MTHVHDFRFVKRYWVGRRNRVYWLLYRCACGEEQRKKALSCAPCPESAVLAEDSITVEALDIIMVLVRDKRLAAFSADIFF
jgi:hypothetical protein